jgi:threonine dehydrogenase-like Zn-dependent dehydrogenase
MKTAVLEYIQKLAIRQVPDPAAGQREVVLRVRGTGICATDFHLFLGLSHYWSKSEFPTSSRSWAPFPT